MELRHLRYFAAVADTLNFHRAAERVHIEQSPLSQQIRKLEQELGVQLFVRNKRRVALTHAGRIFLRDAKEILSRAGRAAERARAASRGSLGGLPIGYLTSMTSDPFTGLIQKFQRQYPEVKLTFNDMIPDAILSALSQRKIDVGFMRGVFNTTEFTIEEVWQESLMVAIPKGHKLARMKRLSGYELAEEPFVMVPDDGSMGYNDVIRAFCNAHGFNPAVCAEANQMQAVIWLVHLGVGLALIPASLKGFIRDNVVYLPLLDAPTLASQMVHRKNESSPVVENFCNLAHSLFKDNVVNSRGGTGR